MIVHTADFRYECLAEACPGLSLATIPTHPPAEGCSLERLDALNAYWRCVACNGDHGKVRTFGDVR